MLRSIYRRPWWSERVRECWLGESIERFLVHLKALGYSRVSLRNGAYTLLRYASFVQEKGSCRIDDLPKWTGQYIARYSNHHTRSSVLGAINHFIRHLQREGILPPRGSERSPPPFSPVVAEYEQFLRQCRGLQADTIARRTRYCGKFLQYIRNTGTVRLRAATYHVVQAFILSEGTHYSRKTMCDRCAMLRQFLSYLYSAGQTSVDLSPAVIAPTTYRHDRCPRFLTRKEVETVLAAVDRRTRHGRRDYAMLLLLATYGLRGIEAVRLGLDDIDWRAERIHIRGRKAGNSSAYPLTAPVGNAILMYLKGRPDSPCRRVFVTHCAPHGPVQTGTLIYWLQKHLRRTGLPTEGVGTHVFRYSCAQRLFEADSPLKLIGDYLGHRDLNTTHRYIKSDVGHLRDVALSLEEDLI